MITTITSLEEMCDLMCDNRLPGREKGMKREIAIEILAGRYLVPADKRADKYAEEVNKALDMAIEALNRERQIIENGYTGKEMRFRMDGKLFAVRELAQ